MIVVSMITLPPPSNSDLISNPRFEYYHRQVPRGIILYLGPSSAG